MGDKLLDLVERLDSDSPPESGEWRDVLTEQPPQTATDLWTLLESEGTPGARENYRIGLLGAGESIAAEHAKRTLSPLAWRPQMQLCMEILGLCGDGDHLSGALTVLSVPRSASDEFPQEYSVDTATRLIRESVLATLERDKRALRVTGRHYGNTQADSILLRAVGDCTHPLAAEILGEWLGVRPELDPVLLTQISSVLRNPSTRLHDTGLNRIRPLLEHTSARIRHGAVRVLGAADDVASIKPIIALLRDRDKSVQNESLLTLQRITAMTIDGDPDRWLFWFNEETNWWNKQSQTTMAALEVAHPEDIAEHLRNLASKRLFRREITPRILPLLADRRTEVVRLTIATIEALRPPLDMVESQLLELVSHRSPQVSQEAARTLKVLGGNPKAIVKTQEAPVR